MKRVTAIKKTENFAEKHILIILLVPLLVTLCSVLLYLVYLMPGTSWRVLTLSIIAATVAAAGLYCRSSMKDSATATDLVRELPWYYLGLTYAAFRIMPPLVLTHQALRAPSLWILVLLSILFLLGESRYALQYRYE